MESLSSKMNVMVVGAAGGIGKSLSLLLASSDFVNKLILCDIAPTDGIRVELSHINCQCTIKTQDENNCDDDIDLIMMCCGKPQNNPNEKRDDLLKINANIYNNLVTKISKRQKSIPVFVIIGNPVNSLVVICSESLKKIGKYDPKKLIGFSELDFIRGKNMVAKSLGLNPKDIIVPIIGGHSEKTIYPLLSHVCMVSSGKKVQIEENQRQMIFDEIRFAGDNVLKAYNNKGTATLSTSYAAFELAKTIYDEEGHIHFAYVNHPFGKDKKIPDFMTIGVAYCRSGISKFYDPSEYLQTIPEKQILLDEIDMNIKNAMKFV